MTCTYFSHLSFRIRPVFNILDLVSRLNNSDYQFLVVRSTFWPFIKVLLDDRLGCETRKNCVTSLNEHVNECNLEVLKVLDFDKDLDFEKCFLGLDIDYFTTPS